MTTREGWFYVHDTHPLFLALHGLGAIVPAIAAVKAAGVDLNRIAYDHKGDGVEVQSLLDIALANAGDGAIAALLAAGLDSNAPDVNGILPLFLIDAMAVDTVEAFIATGARVNVRNGEGRTPLFRACYDDVPIDTVRVLLNAGVDVNATDDHGETALHEATSNAADPTDRVRLLIDAGADVNAADLDGRGPLLNAALCDQVACVRLLLERGADAVRVVMHPDFPKGATTDAVKVVREAAAEEERRSLRAVADGEVGDVIGVARRRL
jgi:hypothetical protein